MKVKTFLESGDSSNSYILYDSSKCVIVDPDEGRNEIDFIQDNKLELKAILLTHAHYDHILGIKGIQDIDKDIPIYVSHNDLPLLQDGRNNLSYYNLGKNVTVNGNLKFIKEGDIIKLLDEPIKVIDTPYHTPGSVSYILEKSKIILCGDSLFHLSIGRSDFPHSEPQKIKSTLEKFKNFKENYTLYPGHGQQSELDIEKQFNPYLVGGK